MHHFRFHIPALLAALCFLTSTASTSFAEESPKPHKLLFYHRSAGFEHSVVKEKDGKPCYAETILPPHLRKKSLGPGEHEGWLNLHA